MKNRTLIFAFCLLGQLSGCSYGYRATGTMDGQAAPLAGKADLRNSGGGRFSLASPDSGLMCEGNAEPPARPSSRAGCDGESGTGEMRCSDGRIFALEWRALTCRAFEGAGRDPNGNTVRFTVKRDPR